MANDFFDKYKTKGSEDLDTIAQQVTPTAPSVPTASASVTPSTPTTLAETAQEKPAAAVDTTALGITPTTDETMPTFGGLRFTQDANNGFTAPMRIGTPAASHAVPVATQKTILGVPLLYIGLVLVAVLAIILSVLLFGRGKALPSMTGWSTSEAELWANENKVNMRVEKIYSDEISSGTIISQSPIEGERVGSGEFLTITVSDGPDLSVMVPVPDVMNMTMAEVEAWAAENFMTTVRVTTQTSDTVASGQVISFTINDNTVLEDSIRRDTPFYVVFSKGKPVGEAIELANFLTMSVSEAEAYVLEKELTLIQEEEFSDTVLEGNIIRQDIKAGENVYAGDVITIVVSKGKEILVPSFYGLSRELAAATASGLGIQTLVEETYSTSEKDVLLSQSIKAGTLYKEGDIVVLRYSMGNSFAVPTFIGQSEADVYAWRDGLNADGANLSVVVTHTDNSAAKGTILEQSHKNESVTLGDTVYVIVSKGQPVTVPSFVQTASGNYATIITKAEVISACDALGLIPMFVEEGCEGRLPGEVWYQSLAAGSEARAGDAITIKVVPASEAASVTVPSLVGKTFAEAKATSGYGNFAITYLDETGMAIDASSISASDIIKTQSVAAGSSVKAGYALVLTVQMAATPEPEATSTPDA